MIKIPKETIIQKIKEKAGLSDQEIKSRVKDKLDQLSGLISEEGALHIIANELGVKIFEDPGKLQVKNVLPGMRNVELTGKIIQVYEIREFEKDGRKGRLGSFMIGDETGNVRVVAWNDKADILTKLKENDIISIENGYARDNRGRLEVHLGDKTVIKINPSDVQKIELQAGPVRKKIAELLENEDNVEIMGTIVQVFDPRFFELCPTCNKRVREKEGVFICDTHNEVEPNYGYVLNLFLDDGTENIRVVLWKNQVQRLLDMEDQEIVAKRESGFEDIKNDLLGKIKKFVGRSTKNEMFDRVEFVPNLVFTPDPDEEIQRLDKELEQNSEEIPTVPSKENDEHEVTIRPNIFVPETSDAEVSDTDSEYTEESIPESKEDLIFESEEDTKLSEDVSDEPDEALLSIDDLDQDVELLDSNETLDDDLETDEDIKDLDSL